MIGPSGGQPLAGLSAARGSTTLRAYLVFQLLLISNVIFKHGLPDSGTRHYEFGRHRIEVCAFWRWHVQVRVLLCDVRATVRAVARACSRTRERLQLGCGARRKPISFKSIDVEAFRAVGAEMPSFRGFRNRVDGNFSPCHDLGALLFSQPAHHSLIMMFSYTYVCLVTHMCSTDLYHKGYHLNQHCFHVFKL
jgi:hypothetical protein